jgi:hypothetical protein
MRISIFLSLFLAALASISIDVVTGQLFGRSRFGSRYSRGRYYDSEDEDRFDDRSDSRRNDRSRDRWGFDSGEFSLDSQDRDDNYYRRGGSFYLFGGGRGGRASRYNFYGRRDRDGARNQDIVAGISGPRAYGDSCIIKPRYISRRYQGSKRRLPVNVRDLKAILRHCDRQVMDLAIDNNRALRRGGSPGCVYHRTETFLDFWSPDPNVYLYTPFYTRQQRRDARRRRTRKYRCGTRNINYNTLHLAADKEYCRRLRTYTVTPYCNACEYSAIISKHEQLKSCTRRKMRKTANSPALVNLYMTQCMQDLARRERRC